MVTRGLRKVFTAMKKAKDERLICSTNERIFYWYEPYDDTWAVVRTDPRGDDFPEVGERVLVKGFNDGHLVGFARIQTFLTEINPTTMSALVDLDILSDPFSPL
jgi:hypothetical protein